MENFFETEILDDTSISIQKLDISVILSTPEPDKVKNFHEYFDEKFRNVIMKDIYTTAKVIENRYDIKQHLKYLKSEIIKKRKLNEKNSGYIHPSKEDETENWKCIKYEIILYLQCTAVGWFILKTSLLGNNLNFDF
jgi:hypothetical protein